MTTATARVDDPIAAAAVTPAVTPAVTTAVTPVVTDLDDLATLASDPAASARRACEARTRAFARQIWIRPAPPPTSAAAATRLHDDVDRDLSAATCPKDPVSSDMSSGPAWPDPADIDPGDRILLRVDHDQHPAYCAWLIRAAAHAPGGWSLAPYCVAAGGLFRLHLIAAARLAQPPRVRVEVRHDLHGVRLAQVALGFGADTLSGPIDAGRHLPLAGVPRPSETSHDALAELVRQAGLEPVTHPSSARITP